MLDDLSHTDLAEQIQDPDFRRLYAHWLNCKGHRFAPGREAVDPTVFGSLLGDLILLEVHTDPVRYFFRVHGTRLAERANYDMTGRYVDEMPYRENRDWLLNRCESLCSQRLPEHGLHDRIVDYRRWRYEVLWLPISSNGEKVDMLLGALRYRDTRETARALNAEEQAALSAEA